MKGKPKRHGLTPRQRRFVSAYLVSLNAAEAARKAGYKGENSDVVGQWYLSRPLVKSSISERLSTIMAAEADTIKHKVLTELQKEAFDSETVVSMTQGSGKDTYEVDRYNPAKMKALELLAKYGGLLIEKHEITGKDGGPIVLKWPDDNHPTT